MIQIKNTIKSYGIIAILFHWLMALLVLFLLGLGLYMVGLPISLAKLKLYGWHKELGMLALGLGLIRWFWRLSNKVPQMPKSVPRWQTYGARIAHILFYGFIILVPLSGWLISSAAGLPVSFFGWFIFPDLIAPDKTLMPLFIDIHKCLSYGLIALLCVHIAAALWHHFIYKDTVLKRMLS